MSAQRGDACEFGVGPLFQELTHHPALRGCHLTIRRIPAVPVRHSQQTAGTENAKQFIRITLLVGHVGTCLHAPDRIKPPLGEVEIERIHHRKATAAQIGGGQLPGPLDLGGADADAKHIKAVAAGQKS